MKRIVFAFFLCSFLFTCDSDDNNTQDLQNDNFYALTVGNSWEYRYYLYDIQNGVFEPTDVIESVSIISTEEISGEIYFKFRHFTTGNDNDSPGYLPDGETFNYLREDSGNLVNQNNKELFIREDNQERLVNYIDLGGGNSLSEYRILLDGSFSITTEAGVFDTLAVELFVRDEDDVQYQSNSRHFYANGIGSILNETSFVSDPQHFLERRLESYNVQ